jgi:hypothetical protein
MVTESNERKDDLMNFLSATSKRRAVGLAGACALALSGIASATVAGAGPANAATCTAADPTAVPPVDAVPCVITGSADLTSGSLTAIMPDSLAWSASLSGAAQHVVDISAADQGYTVDDATATGAGWHVTVTATQFTCTPPVGGPTVTAPCTGTDTLPVTGTFSTNGSLDLATDLTAPGQSCTDGPTDCTLPSTTAGDQPTFPVPIAADGTTAATIYNAIAATGIGSVDIGSTTAHPATTPVGWWLGVPGTTVPGTYTSTITVNVIAGPATIA